MKRIINFNYLRVVRYGGFNVFPKKFSPEFLGSYFGMILYSVAK